MRRRHAAGRRGLVLALTVSLGAGEFTRPAEAGAQELRVVPADQEVVLQRADRARVKGDTAAPIRIVEISDFECPYCQQFHVESSGIIDSLYVQSGIARYLWISFPNATHPRAWPAVEAAFCSGAAGRFWQMHDILFERVQQWTSVQDPVGLFVAWAEEIGIDPESYGRCLRNDVTAPLQVKDYDSALRSGIASTPFFVVGDSVAIRGVVSTDRFRAAVDSVLVARGIPTP